MKEVVVLELSKYEAFKKIAINLKEVIDILIEIDKTNELSEETRIKIDDFLIDNGYKA